MKITIGRARILSCDAANSTRETMLATFYTSRVDDACIAHGATGEWLRKPEQRSRIRRAWADGQPVWMIVYDMCALWEGHCIAEREDGLRRVLKKAVLS